MTHRAHLIMPMGGSGSRFSALGFAQPKPLIELQGQPFFYWATRSIEKFAPLADITFVVLREHEERFGICGRIRAAFPQAKQTVIDHVLAGAVLTCLAGAEGIPDDEPVFFGDCDHIFRSRAFERFLAAGDFSAPDGALLTFSSRAPLYSYLAFDAEGRICGTAEKQAVSGSAICGVYYFKSAGLFRDYAARYLKTCAYSEFFMSGVYNEMAADGLTLRDFPTELHIPFGTPEEYLAAKERPEFGGLL